MNHSFSNAPSISAPRSSFDLSHGHKTTFDAGKLIPIFFTEVLPGDTFNLNLTAFARLATPLNPIMDNMYLDVHHFFVPYRLIWDNARKFFGEQVDPGDSIDFTIPIVSGATASDPEGLFTSQLMDYMGIPTDIAPNNVNISALPFRAYTFIYNEWFRDQNLVDSIPFLTTDATENISNYGLLTRGKRHDYFTSALPWPQKGDAVTLPLGTSAPLDIDPTATPINHYFRNSSTSAALASTSLNTDSLGKLENSSGADGYIDLNNTWYADLSTATAASINDLREAFQIQKLLERDARGGTRYSELVRNHFGVNFYDVSYRPEYLGGGSTPINISPIAQTGTGSNASPTTYGTVGDLGAMGTASINGSGFSKSFVEHGLVMTIASARADLTYQQGLHRFFSKQTRYDIYWPSLAHLGEQEILNKEIYTQGTTADDDVFGYQERYAEYRYQPSRISGLFRSKATASLDSWHLSQEFSSLPTLGTTFITENPPLDRCISINTEPHFIMDTLFTIKAARPMPTYGVPGLIDHF